ncbi:MAG TPA: hypothetical protein VN646_25715 [Candidatus Acidoferrum sp.]|nr:hypothetical protein [Candidatus Acidoferrum sp.]
MILILVSFSYSGASVFTKKSSNSLMKELSWTTVIALGCAPAQRGVRAAPVAASVTVRNSLRLLLMVTSVSVVGARRRNWREK